MLQRGEAVELGQPARALDASGATMTAAADGRLVLPAGGPYTIEAGGERVADGVLVGDLWVLAGQSNMQGAGRLVDVEPPHPLVGLLDMARRWRPAEEPLCVVLDSPDAAHRRIAPEHVEFFEDAGRGIGAGLGLPFARALVAATGVPVGLIATAHGGTRIAEWAPGRRVPGDETLYGSLLESVRAAGGRVAGVLWFQGESDAVHVPDAPASFGPAVGELVAALREDIGNAGLRFLHVQLGRYVGEEPPEVEARWNAVRELQRTFAGADGTAASVDLALDDAIHIGTTDLKRLGRRLARLAAGAPTLALASVDLESRGRVGTGELLVLRVRYEGVGGGLRAPGRVLGFSVRDAAGRPIPVLFRAEVAPDDASSVLLHLSPAPPPGAQLWYGYGLDPACNLVDAEDVAAPAFGPLPVPS